MAFNDKKEDFSYEREKQVSRAYSSNERMASYTISDAEYRRSAYNEKDEKPNKELYVIKVRAQLRLMNIKAQYFVEKSELYLLTGCSNLKKYKTAHDAVSLVITKITELTNQYALNEIDLIQFQKESKAALSDHNDYIKALKTHRGWRQIIANLLTAIIGGIFYLAAAACTGSWTLFKVPTDTGNRLKALSKSIEDLNEPDNEVIESFVPNKSDQAIDDLDLSSICYPS